MKRLIIRADDLGYSEAVNYGIEKSIRDGLVRSAGLMTNMEAAAHGVALVKDTGVCLGQHTNICVGRPLTDPALIPSLCQPNGEFKVSRTYRDAAKRGEDFVVLEEVVLEIEAQYRRFIQLTGKQPGYFEGHAVASGNYFKGLEIVAQRYGLNYFKIVPGGVCSFCGIDVHVCVAEDFNCYDPMDILKKTLAQEHSDEAVDAFILHPGYLDDYILTHSTLTIPRTKDVKMICAPETKAWLDAQPVRLITYEDLI